MKFFKWLFKRKKSRQIKLGLALGSGGAKGFAELGALKAFEENGISFDIIAGTSIGSIIGAFYADGYSSTDILELLKKIDFGEIKNLFMIKMDTAGLFNVIDRSIGTLNIEELKKPFRAIATEVDEAKEHVFDSGSVAKALCASASYPPFFKPVIIEDKRYIDGAFTNAVPADVVKELGADYIVGIDLSNHEKKKGILSKIFPTFSGGVEEPWGKGYEFSNVVIKPELKDFSPVQFWLGDEMYDIGYQSALEKIPQILSDIENLKKKK